MAKLTIKSCRKGECIDQYFYLGEILLHLRRLKSQVGELLVSHGDCLVKSSVFSLKLTLLSRQVIVVRT